MKKVYSTETLGYLIFKNQYYCNKLSGIFYVDETQILVHPFPSLNHFQNVFLDCFLGHFSYDYSSD